MKIGSSVRNKIMTLRKMKLFIPIILSLFVFNYCNTSVETEVFTYSGTTMGTTYSIKMVAPTHHKNNKNFKSIIDSVLIEVNNQMSTYQNDSELSQFNSLKDTTWFNVSEDLSLVIKQAIEIAEQTENVYDITIGPVVNLWGFGPSSNSVIVPSNKEINEAKNKTGIDKLEVDSSQIRKTNPDLYCDLSSIAKGFGVDKVGLLLEEYDVENYMVEIGGEVRTIGKNVKNENWKIGISTPLSNGLQKVLSISNVSVATSGDYLNYFENNGIRYSHLIDPRIGKPITHNLASVTVVNKDCRTADAFATAINVMGPSEGYEFALKKNLPIFMIVREDSGFVEKMTPEFTKFVLERK